MSGDKRRVPKMNRSLSRNMLNKDMEMISHYARKYSNPNIPPPNKNSNNNNPNRAMKRHNTYTSTMIVNSASGGHKNYNNYSGSSSYAPNRSYGQMPAHQMHNSGSSNYTDHSNNNNNNYASRQRRRSSNLLQPGNTSQWDQQSLSHEESDMTAAMTNILGSQQSKLSAQANFLDEIQELSENDANFCDNTQADDWTFKEVCFWLSKINLHKYIHSFQNQIIDGSILLRDLDEGMLTNELGVKRLHVKKILREIKKLKSVCPKFQPSTDSNRAALIESLRNQVDVLKQENKRLKADIERRQSQGQGNGNNANANGNGNGNGSKKKQQNNNNSNSKAKAKTNHRK